MHASVSISSSTNCSKYAEAKLEKECVCGPSFLLNTVQEAVSLLAGPITVMVLSKMEVYFTPFVIGSAKIVIIFLIIKACNLYWISDLKIPYCNLRWYLRGERLGCLRGPLTFPMRGTYQFQQTIWGWENSVSHLVPCMVIVMRIGAFPAFCFQKKGRKKCAGCAI